MIYDDDENPIQGYHMFIDDERFPPGLDDDQWIIPRSSSEAIEMVKLFGLPGFISFDHDLGGEDTSMYFINWLIGFIMTKNSQGEHLDFPQYTVHSQNPVGAENIKGLIESFKAHLEREKAK